MQTLMIPVAQITSPGMKAASCATGLISLQYDPKHPLNATTKCSPLSVISEGHSSRALSAHQQTTHLVIRCTSGTTLLSFQFPRPNNSNPYSAQLERGGRGRAGAGITDVRASLGSSSSSPFPSSRGASGSTLNVSATGSAAAAFPDGFSSEAEDPEKASLRQNSRVLWSVSEKPSAMEAAENSGEDGEEGLVQKTTRVLQAGRQESEGASEPLVLTEEEYKLTEEGTLRTVKVTRGGTTHRTDTEVSRVLAEVGIQAESLQQKIQNFSVRKFIQEWGKKKPGLEDLKLNPAMYAPKEGVSSITQWTATELTLQRAQLVRISTDAAYLVWAFSFFGAVRILEAVVAVFATSPPNFMKIMQGMNAMDPLTVASLAHAVRKPIVGLLEVEPSNLEEVSSLKVKFLSELHKFYERQWKVIATLGVARLFALIVTRLPNAEWFTSKLKVVWDISMALPIF